MLNYLQTTSLQSVEDVTDLQRILSERSDAERNLLRDVHARFSDAPVSRHESAGNYINTSAQSTTYTSDWAMEANRGHSGSMLRDAGLHTSAYTHNTTMYDNIDHSCDNSYQNCLSNEVSEVSWVSDDRYRGGNINQTVVAESTYGSVPSFEHPPSNAVLCHCGLPCIELTSRQESSLNRKFYKCTNSRLHQSEGLPSCDFFQWADGESDTNRNQFQGFSSAPIDQSVMLPGIRDYMTEIKRVFGHNSFRTGQRECIEAALSGRDVFCLMPTGGIECSMPHRIDTFHDV